MSVKLERDKRRQLLGQKLAAGRRQNGLDLAQLAEIVGCPEQDLALYEEGVLSIPLNCLHAVAAALDLPAEEIMPLVFPVPSPHPTESK